MGKLQICITLTLLVFLVLGSNIIASADVKLLASDGAQDDWFSFSLSVHGDVALVGAYGDDDNGNVSGAAYVFRWNGSSWMQEQKLLPSDGAKGDKFGYSVSIWRDVALVSAHGNSENGRDAGAAYVFRWNGSSWVQEQKLLPSDPVEDVQFGRPVSICGDVALVGDPGDYRNGGTGSGAAYVFRWNGSKWVEEQKLISSDIAGGDAFGGGLAVNGDVALVVASGDDDNGDHSGSVYVFRWNGSSWVEEQKFFPVDGTVFTVAISGDVALLGAPGDDGKDMSSGAAYVFRWNGSSWVQEQKLVASDGKQNDSFGYSVSISGNWALVGARRDDDNGEDSGSAYVFRWNGSSWVQEQKLLPSDGAKLDFYGRSVAISGDKILVGAYLDDDKGNDSGSVYVYTLAEGAPLELSSVVITGPTELNENSGAQFNCAAFYNDGTSANVTNSATWSENCSRARISNNGFFSTSLVWANESCSIAAAYGGKSGTHSVTIIDTGTMSMPWMPLLLLDD
ncbi:MAG: FG-GAP repeat protein [Deltaproteobacteria bacterium]|nr:FG-GAP repeat protein [Deltaproteobacteria bacterium]MBW2072875.1 FG-GAP repeat protein [Deltaproteobacteria bacterium]